MATDFSAEELQRAAQDYADEIRRTGAVSRETANAFRDATLGIRGFTRQVEYNQKELARSLQALGQSIASGREGIGLLADVTQKSGTALGDQFTKFSKALGFAADGMGKFAAESLKQAQVLQTAFQQLSKVGSVGASGMSGVFDTLQQFNYAVSDAGAAQLAALMKDNAETLQMFGGSVMKGTQEFGKIADVVHSSDLNVAFRNLGMQTDDVNRSMVAMIRMQRQTGEQTAKSAKEQYEAVRKYVAEQDALTKLTGQTREAQEAAREAMMKDSMARAALRDLEKRAQAGDTEAAAQKAQLEKINAAFAQFGPEVQKGMRDLFLARTQGTQLTAEAIKAEQTLGGYSDMLLDTTQDLGQMRESVGKVMRANEDNAIGLAKVGAEYGFAYNTQADMNEATKDNAEAFKTAKEATKNLMGGTDKLTDTVSKVDLEFNKFRRGLENINNEVLSKIVLPGVKLGQQGSALTNELLADTVKNLRDVVGKLNLPFAVPGADMAQQMAIRLEREARYGTGQPTAGPSGPATTPPFLPPAAPGPAGTTPSFSFPNFRLPEMPNVTDFLNDLMRRFQNPTTGTGAGSQPTPAGPAGREYQRPETPPRGPDVERPPQGEREQSSLTDTMTRTLDQLLQTMRDQALVTDDMRSALNSIRDINTRILQIQQ